MDIKKKKFTKYFFYLKIIDKDLLVRKRTINDRDYLVLSTTKFAIAVKPILASESSKILK